MRGLAAYLLGLVAVVLVATRGGGAVACPAIAWSNALTVEVADAWRGATAVRVECPSPCGLVVEPVDDGPDAVTVPLTGRTATLPLMGAPDSVVVTVLDAGGAVLTRADLALDWVRVGGSTECGGPLEATASVPAP